MCGQNARSSFSPTWLSTWSRRQLSSRSSSTSSCLPRCSSSTTGTSGSFPTVGWCAWLTVRTGQHWNRFFFLFVHFFDFWSFLYKQCTNSLPLFQRNTNKQTHEVDGMLKQFKTAAASALLQKKGTVAWNWFNIPSTSCVCLLVLRWKRGRELVHCLYKKLQTCLPTSRRPGKPFFDFCFEKKKAKKRMKEEEIAKGDYGPSTRNVILRS